VNIQTFSTSFLVPDVARSSAFYVDHFGFRVTFANDWFVSLQHPGNPGFDLCFVLRGHDTIPAPFTHQNPAGALLGWIVDDATAAHQRLRAADVPIVRDLVDEPYGQRHFFCHDLDGVLIDVIERIPIDPEWLAAQQARGATGV
jgi:catechol 2,3-dioxygenase-like lactoylglutathione lyase family enzyme